ncbi:hypothetical protein SZ64_06705 [Erythrobacter sp. SG61-1L]|uniref:hypothetical protein n=1 Tax=Erythrobacter sp. SG61-1L TaxID=1603897 RepID=UPI0006C8EC5F|nr:hypothetical protein [Erythrobacter sp. SG61-1L]KPL67828.1 hypothetical protein SZ64_06705 [Erythrobacter sp. SG61-1L]
MRFLLLPAVAALGLLGAVPAYATTEEAVQCPVLIVPAAVAREMADVMSVTEPTAEQQDAIAAKVKTIGNACRSVHGIADDREEDYLNLTMSGIVMTRLAVDLEEEGIPPSFIDEEMNIGEGRVNLVPDEFPQEVVDALLDRLEAKGLDTASVSSDAWQKVGAYAAATAAYYTLAGSFN